MIKKEQRFIYQIKDKVFLIVTAIGFSLIIYKFVEYLNVKDVPKEWIFFIWGCLVYVGGLIYLVVREVYFKKYPQKAFPLLALFIILPIMIAFAVFYFEALPLPSYLVPYLIGNVVLVPAFVMLFKFCLQRFIQIKRRKTGRF